MANCVCMCGELIIDVLIVESTEGMKKFRFYLKKEELFKSFNFFKSYYVQGKRNAHYNYSPIKNQFPGSSSRTKKKKSTTHTPMKPNHRDQLASETGIA